MYETKLTSLDLSPTNVEETLQSLYLEYSKQPCAFGAIDFVLRCLTRSWLCQDGDQKQATDPLLKTGVIPITAGYKLILGFYRLMGINRFKLKVSPDNLNSLPRVLNAMNQPYYLDANRSLTADQICTLIGNLDEKKNLLGIEDPVPHAEESKLTSMVSGEIPFVADEVLVTREDADRLLESSLYKVWNLRAGKNGGITGVRELARLAAANNIRVRLGCLVGESEALQIQQGILGRMLSFEDQDLGFSPLLLKKNVLQIKEHRLQKSLSGIDLVGSWESFDPKFSFHSTAQTIKKVLTAGQDF